MNTSEILLIIGMVVLVLVPQIFIPRLKKQTQAYIRIGSALLLIALVFLFAEPDKKYIAGIMIILAITGIFKSIVDLRKA